jgi:hypothetical protein
MNGKAIARTAIPAEAETNNEDSNSGNHLKERNTDTERISMNASENQVSKSISDLHLPAVIAV